MQPEGPATGYLDTGFLGFPLSSSKCWDGSQIPSCYCMLLMQPSLSKFFKIPPCSRATKLVNFQFISTFSNESWNKTLPSLSQAFTTHHPNVFTPILSLPEGRADIAWVPSNKILFFPLRYKAPLAFPQMFSLYFYSYTILPDTLSLFGFKLLTQRFWTLSRRHAPWSVRDVTSVCFSLIVY
jgi:hypothetical protein